MEDALGGLDDREEEVETAVGLEAERGAEKLEVKDEEEEDDDDDDDDKENEEEEEIDSGN